MSLIISAQTKHDTGAPSSGFHFVVLMGCSLQASEIQITLLIRGFYEALGSNVRGKEIKCALRLLNMLIGAISLSLHSMILKHHIAV